MEPDRATIKLHELSDAYNRVCAEIVRFHADGPQGGEEAARLEALQAESKRIHEEYGQLRNEMRPVWLARELPNLVAEWRSVTSAMASAVDAPSYYDIAERMTGFDDWIARLRTLRAVLEADAAWLREQAG